MGKKIFLLGAGVLAAVGRAGWACGWPGFPGMEGTWTVCWGCTGRRALLLLGDMWDSGVSLGEAWAASLPGPLPPLVSGCAGSFGGFYMG